MIECERVKIDIAREVVWVRFLQRHISGTEEIEELGRQLYQLLEGSPPRLVLDFAPVEFMSSAAFGKLISLTARAKARDGRVLLCNIRPELLQVFQTCHLDRVFNIRKDKADALACFI